MEPVAAQPRTHSVAVVVPVYRGERTLANLLNEIEPLTQPLQTTGGHTMAVREVLLVHDCGPDNSADVIRELTSKYPFVRPIWLSRNYGQHAATLAGMASTASDWIVTMDEDGQHNPAAVGDLLDAAIADEADVVYASPTNSPAHSRFRNSTSRFAKWLFIRVLSSGDQPQFHSYRLVLGEIGRSVAAYSGSGLYLDVALGWVTNRFSTAPVELRAETDSRSGYSLRSLVSHFWSLVLTSGTRPLRIMSVIGAFFALLGFVSATVIVIGRTSGAIDVDGWTSLAVAVLVGTGLVLFSLGVLAEYIGIAAGMALGKPPYLIVSDRDDGPLRRE